MFPQLSKERPLKDLICFLSKPLLLDKSCTTGTQAIILKSKNRFERTKDISFKLHGSGCIILQYKLVKTIKLQHRSQLRQFSTKLLCWRAQWGHFSTLIGQLSYDVTADTGLCQSQADNISARYFTMYISIFEIE